MRKSKNLVIAAVVVCAVLLGFGVAAYAANDSNEEIEVVAEIEEIVAVEDNELVEEIEETEIIFFSPLRAELADAIAVYDDALQRMGVYIDLADFGSLTRTLYTGNVRMPNMGGSPSIVIESKEDVKILVDIKMILFEADPGAISIDGYLMNALREAELFDFFNDHFDYLTRDVRRQGLLELIDNHTYEEIKSFGLFEISGFRDSLLYLGLTPTPYVTYECNEDLYETYEYLPETIDDSVLPFMETMVKP